MLLELLANIFFGVASMVVGMIPDINFDTAFLSAIGSVGEVMSGVAYVMPMGTFMGCLSVFFLLHNMTLILSIFNWVIRKIPGVS